VVFALGIVVGGLRQQLLSA
jgi:quercetin dioxygenase-like cupin family protein